MFAVSELSAAEKYLAKKTAISQAVLLCPALIAGGGGLIFILALKQYPAAKMNATSKYLEMVIMYTGYNVT